MGLYPYLIVCAAIALARVPSRWRSASLVGFAATGLVSVAVHLVAIMAFPVVPWVPDGLLLNSVTGFSLPYLERGLGTYSIANQFGASVATSHAIFLGLALMALGGLCLPNILRGDSRHRRIVFYSSVLGVGLAALWLQLGSRETPQTPRWRDEVAAAWRHRTTTPPTVLPRI